MRKVILATLIMGIFCSTVYAVNIFNLFRRSEAPAVRNAAEVRAILQSLAPTEAEAKAISELRARILSGEQASSNVPVSQNPDAQIATEFRYISLESPLAEMVLQEPAMNWSMIIPVEPNNNGVRSNTPPWDAPFAAMTPGTAWSGTYMNQPILVRFLDDSNAEKLIRLGQWDTKSNVLTAPKLTLENGQPGMINDTSLIPFVDGVYPIEADYALAYQPSIRMESQGQRLALQGTVLQDGSVRLDRLHADFNTVKEVRKVKLLDDQNGKTVTVQVPSVASFRISIPEIVIPKGMSLLVAMPGMNEKGEMFLLITPKVVEP